MLALTTLLSTAALANAAHSLGVSDALHHKRIAAERLVARANSTWVVEDLFQGETFFDNFNFFTDSDPTHGLVNFVAAGDAKTKGLAVVQADGTAIMAVDDKTTLGNGQNRDSVRITSKKTYNGGLFVADFFAMPHGCGVWPAWWSTGANWPTNGEIDVVEGVSNNKQNQMTLHTGATCTLEKAPVTPGSSAIVGNTISTKCQTINGDNNGCAIIDPRNTSYGEGFNRMAGGVFAHLWDDTGIKMWHFGRDEIPCDLLDQTPEPDSWGTPVAAFTLSGCEVKDAFKDHGLIIDTTLCGDWAGNAFASSGCPGTCADAVKNPDNFKFAKWAINYIAIYQLQ